MEVLIEGATELAIDLTICAVQCVADAVYYLRHGKLLEEKFEEKKKKRAQERAEKKAQRKKA